MKTLQVVVLDWLDDKGPWPGICKSTTANLGWVKDLFHQMKNIKNKLLSKQWQLVTLC